MKIIAGMHRSGTSLVAKLFYEAKADMGNPETFYRADRWNSEGYYEQPAIHEVNMPLVNGPWGKLAYFHLPSPGTVIKRGQRLSAKIAETAADYRGKVVKDPRFCLTLSAWREHGAEIDGFLACLRRPEHVALSLQRRNKIPFSLGLKLWEIHNRSLLAHTAEVPLWLVGYAELMSLETFEAEMRAAGHFFGMEFDDAQVEELRGRSVKASMNHADKENIKCPGRIHDLWEELRDRHEKQTSQIPRSSPPLGGAV